MEPKNAPVGGVLMEPRATFPGAPKAILTLRLCIAWIESMVIDWSTWSDTGRVRFGTCLDFAPLRRFTGHLWLLISGLGGVEGHFIIGRRLG